jgi:hypothetical protein
MVFNDFNDFCRVAEKVAGGGALTRYTSHRRAAVGHFQFLFCERMQYVHEEH